MTSIAVFIYTVALMLMWALLPEYKEFLARTLKFNTCLGLALAAFSLYFARSESEKTTTTQTLAVLSATLATIIGVLTLSQYLIGVSLSLDEFFVADFRNLESSLFPGRMAPIAAICICIMGLALISLHLNRRRIWIHPAPLIAFPAQALSLLALIGYTYNVKIFYQYGEYIRISISGALCIFLICTAISFARKKDALNILTSPGLGGVAARRMLPFALLLPVGLNWVRLYGANEGFFETDLGSAVQALISSIFFVLLIWLNTRILDRVDKERSRTLGRLETSERVMRDAVRARDEFMSIASHELKTPLTALKLQTQMTKRNLLKGEKDHFTPEALEQMATTELRQIDRLARLVDDMLDISRISAGRLTIEKREVNLANLVRDVVDRLRPQMDVGGYKLTLDVQADLTGYWDGFRIEQVVANLLTNAIKYGGGRPIRVAVSQMDNFARLTVSDQGMGIAKENHERIFERFERAIPANQISGLGLGLYIVKQIVEMHEGYIGVDSESGRGATFIVDLPATSY